MPGTVVTKPGSWSRTALIRVNTARHRNQRAPTGLRKASRSWLASGSPNARRPGLPPMASEQSGVWNGTSFPGLVGDRLPRLRHPSCWRSSAGSRAAVPWKQRTGPWPIAARSSGMRLRRAVLNGTPPGDLRGALAPVKEEHFAATTDPKQLAEILRAIDGYEGTLTVRCALRLAPLVFVRPGKLRNAEWADIDLDAAERRYRVTKTKPRTSCRCPHRRSTFSGNCNRSREDVATYFPARGRQPGR